MKGRYNIYLVQGGKTSHYAGPFFYKDVAAAERSKIEAKNPSRVFKVLTEKPKKAA